MRAGSESAELSKTSPFVDADATAWTTQSTPAYRTKYRRYAGSILNSVLTPEARASTTEAGSAPGAELVSSHRQRV